MGELDPCGPWSFAGLGDAEKGVTGPLRKFKARRWYDGKPVIPAQAGIQVVAAFSSFPMAPFR